jgi:N-carbamoyl-L-amino-acid hydrolase
MPEETSDTRRRDHFRACFGGLAAIGRAQDGWTRLAWTEEDRAARAWFHSSAAALGLEVECDRNGNLWAWWGDRRDEAVVTGSHLDTVPGGGAYDGALGVVSGLLAVEELQRAGASPRRPIAVVAFADEEGSRFNTPTFGSRLLTGALDADAVRARTDAAGVSVAAAAAAQGADPKGFGPDPQRLQNLSAFVELHVEQGRGLSDLATPIALCEGIWPHGRWRLSIAGESNHAGTTRMEDRRDPVLVLADAVQSARRAAGVAGRATIGRVAVRPNASNAIAARVDAWLDARAPDDATLDRLLARWQDAVRKAAGEHGCEIVVEEESRTDGARFDAALADRLGERLEREGWKVPLLPTAAGHDAGILAPHVPSAMLFVRNPTGVSHSPAEHATDEDCAEGVQALAALLHELATQ